MISNLAYYSDRSYHRVACLIIFTLVILFLAVPALSAPGSMQVTQAKQVEVERELATLKESSLIRIDALRESWQKGVQLLQQRVDAQDKRIGDLNLILGFASLIITMIGIGVAIAAYWTAGQRAQKSTEQWLEENEKQLRERITELEETADKAIQEVKDSADKAKQKMGDSVLETKQAAKVANETIESTIESLQKKISSGQQHGPSKTEQDALREKEEALKNKPESDYTTEDWSNRAFAAYADGKLALAAEYFDQAERGSLLWTGKLMLLYQLVRRIHETYPSSYFYRRI